MTEPSLLIRSADLGRTTDLLAVCDLLEAFHREEDDRGFAWSVHAGLGPHLRRNAWFVLLAETDGAAVGALVAQRSLSSFSGVESCNIHDVFVLDEARGRGVARGLMEAAESRARALGCGKITLEVNADNMPARGLYRSLGFDVPEVEGPENATLFVRKRLDDPSDQMNTNTT